MILSYSQIVGSDVLAIEDQASIGRVADLVLQKSDMKVKALLLHSRFFFVAPQAITFDDIVDFDTRAVIIQGEEDAVPLKELVSIQQALKAKMNGVKQKVYTKSGKFIGTVYDYTIESGSGLVYTLFVKHLVSDRIIPRSVICELSSKGYIIDDDFELVKSSVTVAEAA